MSDMNRAASTPGGVPGCDDWLQQLDWREFERLVANSYRAHGFHVTPTAPGADGGIDLVLTRGAERYLVQCKHWKASMVGAPVVRELFGLVVAHQATGGIVVTSGTFSQEAYDFARRCGIQLLGRPATLELVAAGRLPDNTLLGGTGPATASTVGTQAGPPRCPVCASPMTVKKARKGQHKGQAFWACPRFPTCRGTAPYPPMAPQPQTTAPAFAAQPRAFSPTGYAAPPRPRRTSSQRRKRGFGGILLRALVPLLALGIGVQLITAMLGAVPTYPVTVPSPSTEPGTIRVGEQPMAIAIDAAAGRAYTANFLSGDVSVVDLDKEIVVETIDVGGEPSAVAVDAERQVLWVADYSAARVRGVDLATGKLIAKLKVDAKPHTLAIDPGRSRLYVTSKDQDKIRVFDTQSHKRVKTIDGKLPGAMVVDTDERVLYVASTTSGMIYAYHLKKDEWGDRLSGGYAPLDLALDEERHFLYEAHSRSIIERNLITGRSNTLTASCYQRGIAIHARTRVAYVACAEENTVRVVELG